jgi:hypothetical protein
MWPKGIPENSRSEDIGGGLLAWIVDGASAHWNIDVPGDWIGPYTLEQVGSYVSSYCEHRAGIYQLIGSGKPAILDRICGPDQTGTLYIGCEGKNFADRSRLSKLVRSLGEPRSTRDGGHIYNEEHNAGSRLRRHPVLSRRFPISKLALTWCYTDSKECYLSERALLDAYFRSFGDTPPLNFRSYRK